MPNLSKFNLPAKQKLSISTTISPKLFTTGAPRMQTGLHADYQLYSHQQDLFLGRWKTSWISFMASRVIPTGSDPMLRAHI